jgi:3-deoxy-D-manno-octulosonate 8-phosphate phosphatase (KDO 8-P phosphatase)
MKPKVFVLDVDGVMTDGQFHYTVDGKVMKIFGADDNDGLSLLSPYLEIQFVTGDHRGFDISKSRIVDDMKKPLDLVSTIKRIDWIKERWDPKEVIYMGDGIFDHYVFREVGYCIAPQNGDEYVKSVADFVTKRSGANRAVAEASLHILEKFFVPYNPNELPDKQIKLSGEWTV